MADNTVEEFGLRRRRWIAPANPGCSRVAQVPIKAWGFLRVLRALSANSAVKSFWPQGPQRKRKGRRETFSGASSSN